LAWIGNGSFGTLYEADDLLRKIRVAIKIEKEIK
jgi:hypothetical protein